MRGWLLCLMNTKPTCGNDNKLTDSDNAYPYTYGSCAHYFFVVNTTKTGAITVTWPANANDQKTNWSAGGTTASQNNLAYWMQQSTNWYTKTVKDANGKVTSTTVTESKGTVTTASDGAKITTATDTAVTTDAAGRKTTTVTTVKTVETADGSTGKIVSDESGKLVSAEAKVSEAAAKSAAQSGEAVRLPITMTAAQSAGDAVPVAVTVPKEAERVKIKIPVADVKAGTVAIIAREDGSEEIVKTSTTTEAGVVLTLEGGAFVKVVDNSKTFIDVGGSEAGSAIPNFVDVSADDWYANSVAWAVSKGVARGEGERFGANDAITREQLAVMLYNYARVTGCDVSMKGEVRQFEDNGGISAWAGDAMTWAVGLDIINGTTDANGTVILDPQGSASPPGVKTGRAGAQQINMVSLTAYFR